LPYLAGMVPLYASARLAPTGVGFARRLAEHGARPALHGPEGVTSYADLARRVERRRREADLAGVPRVQVLAMRPCEDDVVTYLACLAAGHPVLVTDPGSPESARRLAERFAGDGPAPHPDLALLLSTSGSTGSPRLVRLAASAVQANAEAIADYLGLTPDDVAITALPLHYCYGLSVLHSHLAVGASVVLTETSVVDPCFWAAVDDAGVTSVAGVPHSFTMMERAGLRLEDHPSLRLLTQAGGRMDPERVRDWARRGRDAGCDLVVMYGQTEATARMAYLPPDLAEQRPDCVGVPVPGGDLRLDPVPGQPAGVGELVYTGPNVMMGYAEDRADLARGHDLTELRTGDLGSQDPDGLWRVVGRLSRFAKVLGLRVDLDRVEARLREEGYDVLLADGGDRLALAVLAAPGDEARATRVRAAAAGLAGVPEAAVDVVALDALPMLPSGKPDRAAVPALAARQPETTGASAGGSVADLLATVLGRPVGPDDTFAGLGGDSLSYVEASVRLEEHLGRLPADWHLRTAVDLEACATDRAGGSESRWTAQVDTSVVLRAAAIVAIVGTHANLLGVVGGAHVLLAVTGYNLARFALSRPARRDRVRTVLAGAGRVALPAVLWISAVALVTGQYPWTTALLVNHVLGPPGWSEPEWHYWFLEAMVWALVGLAALVAVPAVHRAERRWPFALPVALALLGLLTRYEVVVLRGPDVIHRPEIVLWLVALGWAAARAHDVRRRLVVTALLVATVPGFFEDPAREAVVVVGVLVLVWVRRLRLPRHLVAPLSALAAASLWIYLTHWQVYPHLEVDHPMLATLASLVVGLAAWRVWTPLCRHARRVVAARSSRVLHEVPGR